MNQNNSALNFSVLIETLNKFFKDEKFDYIIVKEFHTISDDFHYHIILKLIGEGIRKNTYRNKIRELFPEFRGMRIDVKGIKQDTGLLKYILKNITFRDIIKFLGDYSSDNKDYLDKISVSSLKFFIEIIKKDKSFKDLFIIVEIMKFSSFFFLI